MVGLRGLSWGGGRLAFQNIPSICFRFIQESCGATPCGVESGCSSALLVCVCAHVYVLSLYCLLIGRCECSYVIPPVIVYVVVLNWIQRNVGYSFSFSSLSNAQGHRRVVKERCKLQALVCDILPPTTAILDYAVGFKNLSANGQLFVGAQITAIL